MNTLPKVVLVAAFCGVFPAAADIMSIGPSALTVSLGQSFSLDVRITGASDLYAYQFDVGFDPSILAANSVAEGTFLAGPGFFPGSIDNVGGTISFVADSLGGAVSGVNGNGTLMTISFTAIATGTSSVRLFNVLELNSFGEGIGGVGVAPAAVTVGTVPEPSSVFLLCAVLAVVFRPGRMRGEARRART